MTNNQSHWCSLVVNNSPHPKSRKSFFLDWDEVCETRHSKQKDHPLAPRLTPLITLNPVNTIVILIPGHISIRRFLFFKHFLRSTSVVFLNHFRTDHRSALWHLEKRGVSLQLSQGTRRLMNNHKHRQVFEITLQDAGPQRRADTQAPPSEVHVCNWHMMKRACM